MIIQCEKCQTRFRLDDSRVTDKGVKVRCTKCKHVFRVHKEGADVEPFAQGTALSGFAPLDSQGDVPAAAPDDQQDVAGDATFVSAGFDGYEDSSADSADDFSLNGTETFDASTITFESDDFDAMAPKSAGPAAIGGGVDFSNFDFGEAISEPDSTPLSTVSAADFIDNDSEYVAVAPRKEALQGLDFSDDDMFGAVVEAAPEESGAAITFDFEGDDSFAESMDMGGHDSSGKSGKLFSLDTAGDAPFSLDEIDFGDELTSVAVQQVNPEDLKPSQEILFAPLAEAQIRPVSTEAAPSLPGVGPIGEQHELPPLSIASRRKQSPLFGIVIAVAALLVVSVLGYIGYSSFSTAKNATPEAGRISVRAVKAVFIKNEGAGDLLVISGEALNEFPKPRAALQVKATVFDSTGTSIATKNAYGGNPLTEEQLESLPLDKIEAAMANQFGDSLANMEVAPGRAIPFVIVVANLPPGAKDFAVQSSGSTVATGKQ
ncbi:MAG: DUF3426 domain-containing protein [Desulfuromonadaceae bacterium]|nr:DUF3426 domain-containing protein [Desulfuromonadaceae bacterium]MDD2848591.1 DUF3426 domain-containing protein [Desulfuromonadaceae bacterium]